MTKPKKLYKYQSFSQYSLRNLKNNHIYFNHPEDFNDPFDTFHEVSIKPLSKEAAKKLFFGKEAERQLFEKIEEKSANNKEIAQILTLLFQLFKTFEIKLFQNLNVDLSKGKKYDSQEFINNIEVNSALYDAIIESFYSSLNITIENSLKLIREQKVYSKGISCFSTEFDSMLMWAYYADGHKGFCLEFNTEYEPFSKMHKVKYKRELPSIDANQIFTDFSGNIEIVEAYLLSKYEGWSHENEWRVLHDKNRIAFGYKPNALTGVYFGSKMSLTDFEIIAVIIKSQHSNCKFYQMEKAPGQFKITPKEITYSTFEEAKKMILNDIKPNIERGITDLEELIKDIKIPISKSHLITLIEAIIDDLKMKK